MATDYTEHLIDEIMPSGELHLLAGPSGAGKTTLLMQMIDEFLDGKSFHGHSSHPAPVFYISCDRTLNEQKRVMDRTKTSWGRFEVRVLGQVIPKGTLPSVQAIVSHVKSTKPETKLIVIDGFATLTPQGKYLDYMVVSAFLRHCQDLCQLYDVTILGVVHFAKEKKGEGYSNQRERIMGSGAWGSFANLVMTLSKDNPEDDQNQTRNLWICPRNGAEVKIKIRMGADGKLQTIAEGEEDDIAKMTLEETIKRFSPGLVFPKKQIEELNKALDAHMRLSESGIDRMIKRLLEEDVIERQGRGKYKKIPDVV